MHFRFSEEEERFRQEVKAFCEKELPPDWTLGEFFPEEAVETDEQWAFYRAFKRKMGAKGWLSIGWPREDGGQDSRMKQVIIEEEINYYGAPGQDCSLTYGIVAPTLIGFCTREQKAKHLPALAAGEVVWVECFSEPNAGSDVAALTTRAVLQGDHFIVNGQKTWTTIGLLADWAIFLVRTDPAASRHKGLSLLMIDMKAAGVIRNPIRNRLGRATWSETFLDNARVPKDNLVGKLNDGWNIAMTTLNNERSGMQWMAASRRGLDRMVKYVRGNKALARDPRIRHRLAGLAIEVELSRLFCYYIEWLRIRGGTPIHEASMAKIYSADLSVRVAEACFQMLGLYGQLREGSRWTPLHGSVLEMFLGYPSWTFGGGSPEIQRNIIANLGLRLPR